MKVYQIFILFLISAGFTSCSIFEPASPTASYLSIDSFTVSTDYTTQGSSSSSIQDVWVITDDGYLGTFPMPAKIPVIGSGSKKITVRAGIIENGISGLRSAYPKYASYDTTLSLEPGKNYSIKPRTTYLTGCTFVQNEDFDDAGLTLTSTSSSTVNLQVTSAGDPNAFEGNSGVVTLSSSQPIFEVASSSLLQFSQVLPTYIELNYKSENDFDVGVFVNLSSGTVDQRTLLSLRASSVWKKVYISLADLGGMATNANGYKVFIRCEKSSSLNTAKLYLDNLKVVY